MEYELVFDKSKNKNVWFPGKNILGGINRAADVVGQGIRFASDPVNILNKATTNRLGLTKGPNISSPELPFLNPSNDIEEYAQHFVSQLALGGLAGAINPQSIGSSAFNLAGNIVASDLGNQAAKSAGLGEVGQFVGSLAGVGLKNSLKPSAIQEKFQPYKKWLYGEVKKEGNNKIASGNLNSLAKEFIQEEQRRTGGKSPYIRRLANWMNETQGDVATAEDIHNFKKDINEYRYHKLQSPSYLKAIEKEIHKVIDTAGKSKRTDTNLTLPNWTKNLKKADKLHEILTIKESAPGLEKGIDWLFKFSPTLGKALKHTTKSLTAPARLAYNFPKKTWDHFTQEVIKGIEKNPAAFQPQIKKLNHMIDKESDNYELIF